ncbi:hypothetical protein WJX74_001927 [Apatococcus lobatus]|uniref:Protein kinase domain-containing protein n=1 Tax=Apatococcus lobatus TaxID=904363 RepID=A0AAW1S5J0_9CHLO
MLLSIDQLLPIQSSMRVNFQTQRDQADSDSQMTVRSATGSSLRLDLQLRAEDNVRLLFKGEERGQGHSLADDREDLHAKTAISWLKKAYSQTAQSAGLIHKQPGSPTISVAENVYTIELAPVGLRDGDALPQTEIQACLACHGHLHGLQALRQASLAHRDLCWKNVACDLTKQHHYLLDLELVAPLDFEPTFPALTSSGHDTLENGQVLCEVEGPAIIPKSAIGRHTISVATHHTLLRRP